MKSTVKKVIKFAIFQIKRNVNKFLSNSTTLSTRLAAEYEVIQYVKVAIIKATCIFVVCTTRRFYENLIFRL